MIENREKLLKIYALYKHGLAGEKANAKQLLERELAAQGISFEDFEQHLSTVEPTRMYRFNYKSSLERSLLIQCIAIVSPESNGNLRGNKDKRVKPWIGGTMTESASIKVTMLVEHYLPHLEEAIEDAKLAFFIKHSLLADRTSGEPTEDELEEFRRLKRLSNSLKKVDTPIKKLNSDTEKK